MAERPTARPEPGGDALRLPRDLRCKRRACAALLGRIVGVTLVCLDGTRVGPLTPGQVVARRCPKCGARNVKWV